MMKCGVDIETPKKSMGIRSQEERGNGDDFFIGIRKTELGLSLAFRF